VPANAARRHSKLVTAIVLAGLAGGVVLGGIGWSSAGRESTDSAFVDGHRVAVATQAAGRVSEILVDDNQRVEAGQVLLRIDPADYDVKLQQAEATRAQAAGALAQARAQLPVTEAVALQAQAQVKVAEANARKNASDVQRFHRLSDDAMPRIALDAAETQSVASDAQLDAARHAAAAAKAQVGFARAAIGTAEANVRAAEAQVALARLARSYCELKAPVAGFVARKSVERGNFVQIGQPVLNLVQEDVFVTANFKETQLTHLQPGQPATLTVDTFPGVIFHGRVESRMAGTGSAFALLPPENATGTFIKVVQRVPVKIVFDAANRAQLTRLVVGLSVIATVDVHASSAKQLSSNP
jgi:membrane fusion protein (multidrug efflux system)